MRFLRKKNPNNFAPRKSYKLLYLFRRKSLRTTVRDARPKRARAHFSTTVQLGVLTARFGHFDVITTTTDVCVWCFRFRSIIIFLSDIFVNTAPRRRTVAVVGLYTGRVRIVFFFFVVSFRRSVVGENFYVLPVVEKVHIFHRIYATSSYSLIFE